MMTRCLWSFGALQNENYDERASYLAMGQYLLIPFLVG